MNISIDDSLYANTLGKQLLQWAKECSPKLLAEQVNTEAILLLKEIQSILDDETLDDPECFYRIDAIVSVFHRAGLETTRHWELD